MRQRRNGGATMDEAAAEAGRDPASLRLVLTRNAFVVEDGDAWEAVAAGVAHQWGAYDAWESGHDTPEHDSLEPPTEPSDPARAATVAGTPDRVVHDLAAAVAPFRDRTVDLVVRLHYPGMAFETAARAIELFGSAVVPRLTGS